MNRKTFLLSLPFFGVRVAPETGERVSVSNIITVELNGPKDERIILVKSSVASVQQDPQNPDLRQVFMNNGNLYFVVNSIDDIVTGLNR